MYFESSFEVLHSMASFRILFDARTSAEGYLDDPEPAIRTAAHSFVAQNLWMRSRSALMPFDFLLIMEV